MKMAGAFRKAFQEKSLREQGIDPRSWEAHLSDLTRKERKGERKNAVERRRAQLLKSAGLH